MTRWTACAMVVAVAFWVSAGIANAQLFYTHTSGLQGDGFNWPFSVLDEDQYDTPDGITYYNFSGNTAFFDSSYQAAGNSPDIDGDAYWGNPLDTGNGDVGIATLNSGHGASTIGLDFSWAMNGQDAPDFLELQIFDFDTGPNLDEEYSTLLFVPLGNAWNAGGAFGGFDGRSGRIELDASELIDDETFETFQDIDDVLIYIGEIAGGGLDSEWAIDNVSIDGGSGGNDSEVLFTGNSGAIEFVDGTTLTSNYLRKPGTATFSTIEVTNKGGTDTTFSTSFSSRLAQR